MTSLGDYPHPGRFHLAGKQKATPENPAVRPASPGASRDSFISSPAVGNWKENPRSYPGHSSLNRVHVCSAVFLISALVSLRLSRLRTYVL